MGDMGDKGDNFHFCRSYRISAITAFFAHIALVANIARIFDMEQSSSFGEDFKKKTIAIAMWYQFQHQNMTYIPVVQSGYANNVNKEKSTSFL